MVKNSTRKAVREAVGIVTGFMEYFSIGIGRAQASKTRKKLKGVIPPFCKRLTNWHGDSFFAGACLNES
jgi:hypothetical protein